MPASTMTGTRDARGTPGLIRNDCVWSGAGAYWVFPACEAVIAQVPGRTVVTSEPATEQTPGVSERNETVNPDDADAETVNVTPVT
jgi:hypothetical protein